MVRVPKEFTDTHTFDYIVLPSFVLVLVHLFRLSSLGMKSFSICFFIRP